MTTNAQTTFQPLCNLRDRSVFPLFKSLPDEHDLDMRYYRDDGSHKQHWCFIGEITNVEVFLRPRLIVKDEDGDELPIAYYLEKEDEPEFRHRLGPRLKAGHTILVTYPERHGFMDLTTGFRIEDVDGSIVFPVPYERLLAINDAMQDYPNQDACDRCSKTAGEAEAGKLLLCGGCRGPKYCGKSCQLEAWGNGHKKDCKVINELKPILKTNMFVFQGDWISLKA